MAAIFCHGGHDNLMENNIFVACKRAIGASPWNDKRWMAALRWKTYQTRLLKEVDITKPPYTTRYPELMEIDRWLAVGKGVPPEGNRVLRNIFISGEWLKIHWEASEALVDVRDNWLEGDPGFVDAGRPGKARFALRDDAPVLRFIGFQHLPLERIGMCEDEYRRSVHQQA
jgi:hypothetical protein